MPHGSWGSRDFMLRDKTIIAQRIDVRKQPFRRSFPTSGEMWTPSPHPRLLPMAERCHGTSVNVQLHSQ